jgi:hypothetical protein
MSEMLDSLDSLPEAVRSTFRRQSQNFFGKYNILRIGFAHSLVTERQIIIELIIMPFPLSPVVDDNEVQTARDWIASKNRNLRDAVRRLIGKWTLYRSVVDEPERYGVLKDDLYKVRNAGFEGNPDPP